MDFSTVCSALSLRMIRQVLIILFCVPPCIATSPAIYRNGVHGFKLGDVEAVAFDKVSDIQALEIDNYNPGNILYIDGSSLRTLDPDTYTVHRIVGLVYSYYDESREGVGLEASFMWPNDFTQINSSHVVIVDTGSYCVRLVDRFTNSTSLLAGICGVDNFGFQDGTFQSAKFGKLTSIALYPKSDELTLLAIDHDNKKIRKLNLQTQVVSTLSADFDRSLRTLAIQPTTGVIFFSVNQVFGMISNLTEQPEDLSGYEADLPISWDNSYMDGPLPSAFFSGFTMDLKFMTSEILLIVDQLNNNIRVVDLVSGSVSSVCVRWSALPGDPFFTTTPRPPSYTSGNISECGLHDPTSVLYDPARGKIWIGQEEAIGFIEIQGANEDSENLTDLITFTSLTIESVVTEQPTQTINSNKEGKPSQPSSTYTSTTLLSEGIYGTSLTTSSMSLSENSSTADTVDTKSSISLPLIVSLSIIVPLIACGVGIIIYCTNRWRRGSQSNSSSKFQNSGVSLSMQGSGSRGSDRDQENRAELDIGGQQHGRDVQILTVSETNGENGEQEDVYEMINDQYYELPVDVDSDNPFSDQMFSTKTDTDNNRVYENDSAVFLRYEECQSKYVQKTISDSDQPVYILNPTCEDQSEPCPPPDVYILDPTCQEQTQAESSESRSLQPSPISALDSSDHTEYILDPTSQQQTQSEPSESRSLQSSPIPSLNSYDHAESILDPACPEQTDTCPLSDVYVLDPMILDETE